MKTHLRNIFFEVDDSYQPEFWNFYNSGKWEPNTFDIIDDFTYTNSCVVDMGCWIGPLSLYSAKKGAQVYAIDPDPEAFKWLIKNLSLNPELKKRIQVANIAISPKTGELNLYAREKYGTSSTSILKRARDKVSHSISTSYRLDEFIEINKIGKIDLLKIDIEGGEFVIIDQLEALKKGKKYKTLFLSIHYNQLNEVIYQKKIRFNFFSLILMKLERITGRYLFKSQLLDSLKKITTLCESFDYIYTSNGKLIPLKHMTPEYLLKNKIDLLLTDTKWK